MIRKASFALCLFLSACAPDRTEREKERLELERKAAREAEAANKAITEMNRRIFGKKNAAPFQEPDGTAHPPK